jgi:hypothetical protein
VQPNLPRNQREKALGAENPNKRPTSFKDRPRFEISQGEVGAHFIDNRREGLSVPSEVPMIQAAYAAPLILLAQTRQADRNAAHARADAEHREALHQTSEEREEIAAKETALLVDLVKQNTQLTETVKSLTERVEALTLEVHKAVVISPNA